ncbi:hypothetical protein PVAP13_9NG835800 [Panicum virgatum]|uniref:Uncharacterized protein n=1 Tax=Panicum virgatum TaxID=38727 RepID=A0A8T0N5F7_PANVG|nr:hypothetical protein PVAP13_9NG835800 [Panicum virgatum]
MHPSELKIPPLSPARARPSKFGIQTLLSTRSLLIPSSLPRLFSLPPPYQEPSTTHHQHQEPSAWPIPQVPCVAPLRQRTQRGDALCLPRRSGLHHRQPQPVAQHSMRADYGEVRTLLAGAIRSGKNGYTAGLPEYSHAMADGYIGRKERRRAGFGVRVLSNPSCP